MSHWHPAKHILFTWHDKLDFFWTEFFVSKGGHKKGIADKSLTRKFFFFFGWDWGLNSGLHAYKAGALHLHPGLQPILLRFFFFLFVFLKRSGLTKYLPRLALNRDPQVARIRHKPPAPSLGNHLKGKGHICTREQSEHLFSSSNWLRSSTFSLSAASTIVRSWSILASSSRTCWGSKDASEWPISNPETDPGIPQNSYRCYHGGWALL
jgi:hypothetical protein